MIYYPHYTPSKQKLRATLLFTDNISLIVPAVDQEGVQNRSNVRDLFSADPNLFRFLDPQYRYDNWASKDDAERLVQNIIDEVSLEIRAKELPTIRTDQNGTALMGQDDIISHLFYKEKWKYVAVQKLPYGVQDSIFTSNSAAKVGIVRNKETDQVIENDGVLCHPKLADFILSRMAREASFIEGIPSITFGGLDYMNHLFDGSAMHRAAEYALLKSSIDLYVPDNLDSFSARDYLAIRDDYQDLRRSLFSYLREISSEHNLNLPQSTDALINNFSRANETLQKDLAIARQAVGSKRFNSQNAFVLESATTISSALLGAVYSTPLGAMIASGLGLAGSKISNHISTLGDKSDGSLRSIAMSKAKIERRGDQQRWDAPSYWKR